MKSEKIRYLSPDTPTAVTEYLKDCGYTAVAVSPLCIDSPIAGHPDIQMCRLGCYDDSPVFMPKQSSLDALSGDYPKDVPFNAACTGKFFIHNLSYTDPELLAAAREYANLNGLSLICIDVKQGYAKCSCVVVDEDSIITYDAGIAKACTEAGMNVLLVSPGHVELAGYDTGFIGGATGRIGNTIVFCGDITAHPDGAKIIEWIKARGLECKYFDFPLTDIGSLL